MQTIFRGALFLIITSCLARFAVADEWKPARLWVSGTDQSIWMAGKSSAKGASLPVMYLWYAGKDADAFALKQSLNLPPISGDPILVAADSESLHVLFSNETACDYFPQRPYSPGASWTEQSRTAPLAWAGDSSTTGLWAIVHTDDLRAMPTSSGPSEAEEASTSKEAIESQYALLQLRGGVWRRYAAPPQADKAGTVWLAVRNGKVALFWKEGGEIPCAQRIAGEWKQPVTLPIDEEVRHGWAAAGPDGFLFIAGQKESSGVMELHLFAEKGDAWNRLGAAREGNELLTVDPNVCGVGVARGQLAVARPTPAGAIELGLSPLDAAPALRFAPVQARQEQIAQRSRWEDALTLGLLLGVVTVALWSRREEAVRVMVLPQGIVLTPVWKRALAGIVDIVPPALFTSPWWAVKLAPLANDLSQMFTPEQGSYLEEQTRLEFYATIVCYGLWCLAWEAMYSRTPGKMILGCRVISIDGSSPSLRQCVSRNLIRMIMVALGAGGLLVTLMTMTVVTRNRQRLGDLLARTLVVEPGLTPPDKPPARADDMGGTGE